MTTREAFLQKVRQAVNDGNQAGTAAPLPERGNIGIGVPADDPDLLQRFTVALANVGGKAYGVSQLSDVLPVILRLIEEKKARRILLGRHALFDELGLADALRQAGCEVIAVAELTATSCREPFFQADIGVSVPDYLVAETGTIAMPCSPAEPRSVSLLPPVHIVLAEKKRILADLFDLFARFPAAGPLPSCLTLITGPSKTGDIELRLVTGVHGPGEVHVILF